MSAKPDEAAPGAAGVFPEWASGAAIVDPISGEANFVVPPAGVQATGFVPYRVKPPRNWVNYLFRQGWRWFSYLDQTAQRGCTLRVSASVAGGANQNSLRMAEYVCDNTDDHVQINAAIAACAAFGGGTVSLSEGAFTIAASVVMASGVVLEGAGPATILRIPAAIAASFTIISATALTGAWLRDFAVDGNKAAIGAFEHDGVLFTGCTECAAERVRVANCNRTGARGYGFQVTTSTMQRLTRCHAEGNEHIQFALTTGSRCVLSKCRAISGNGVGFSVTGAGGTNHEHVLTNCTGYGNHATVNVADFDIAAEGTLVTGCVSDGLTVAGDGFRSVNFPRIHFANCTSRAHGDDNFLLSADDTIAEGCVSDAAGDVGFNISGDRPLLTACHATGSTTVGFLLDGAEEFQLTTCRSESSGTHGYQAIDSYRGLFSACFARNNGTSAPGGAFADWFITSSTGASVNGCRSVNPGAGNRVSRSVWVDNQVQSVAVNGNFLQQGHTPGNRGNAIQVDVAATDLPLPTSEANVTTTNIQV